MNKRPSQVSICVSNISSVSDSVSGRALLEWKGLLGPCGESNTLPTSVELEAAEAGGGVRGVRGELGADAAIPSDSLSGMRL